MALLDHRWTRAFPGLPDLLVERYQRSRLILRTRINLGGAGYGSLSRQFLEFCARTAAGYSYSASILAETGFLMHKYSPGGSVGTSWQPWLEGADTRCHGGFQSAGAGDLRRLRSAGPAHGEHRPDGGAAPVGAGGQVS